MNGLAVLALGLGLGLRHATDADHIVVVSTLVQRESGTWRAARIAALWGAGHTVSTFALGLLIVLADVRVPQAFERTAELAVACMLVGLGVWHLARSPRDAKAKTTPATNANANTNSDESAAKAACASSSAVRPMAIGVLHGLAGSAGLAILAATTIESRAVAVAYLGLVALGTVLGMVALTIALSRPIRWTMHQGPRLRHAATWLAACASMAFGVSMFIRALLELPQH